VYKPDPQGKEQRMGYCTCTQFTQVTLLEREEMIKSGFKTPKTAGVKLQI
jgi:hypothetical protein